MFLAALALFVTLFAFAGGAHAMTRTGGTGTTDPWVSSDMPDYPPGATVGLLGGNWQPGEVIHIVVNDDAGQTWSWSDDVTADASGNISDSLNLPNWFIATYSVTATGGASGTATSSFTDGNVTAATLDIRKSPAPCTTPSTSFTAGDSVCAHSVITTVTGNGSGNISVMWINPSGALATTDAHAGNPNDAFDDVHTVSATGTWTVVVCTNSSFPCGNNQTLATKTFTVAPACTAASVTSQPAGQSITYGANATFTAAGAGSPAPSVQWQVDPGSGFTDITGATSTTLTVTKPPVSASGNKYRAVFTNTCGGTQTATTNAATLTVNRKAITITPNSGQSKLYGASDPTLTYTGSPALESGDSFTGALGRAAGENVGNYAINLGTLSAGNNYSLSLAATTVNFAITARPVTITPNSGQSKVYGASDPPLTFTNDGGLAASAFTGGLGRAAGEDVGNYAINLGTLSAGSNYNLSLSATTVNFAINRAPLSVTADADDTTAAIDHFTKTYGDPNPTFTARYSGFVLGQGPGALGGSLSFDTTATASSGVGAYAVTPKGLTSSNYDISFNAGTLDINRAPLSVTADADDTTAAIDHFTKTYGDPNPTFTARYSGFVLGQGPGALGGSLSFDTTATASSGVGAYAVTPKGLTSSNYDISFNAGTLDINRAPLKITASSPSDITYGDAVPSVTPSFEKFVNGDTVVSLGAGFSCGTVYTQTAGSVPAPYATSCSGAVNGNYDISYVSGSFNVVKKNLNVTASSPADIHSLDPVPSVTPIYGNDFVYGQDQSTLATQPTCGTNYTVGSGPGQYTTSCSGGVSAKYAFVYHDGGFNVDNTAPSVALDAGNDKSVNEGTTHTYAFTITDIDPGDSWSFPSGYPNCGLNGSLVSGSASISGHTGTFQCSFADGPKTTQPKVEVNDSFTSASNEATQTVNIANVAPTIASWSGPNVLSGPMVFGLTGTWSGSFSDPGVNDNPWIASFTWDGAPDPNTQTLNARGPFGAGARPTFTSAGCTKVGTAKVTDKDGDFDTKSTTIQVGSGSFLPPMTNQPVTDQLKNGQVLPVKIRIADCNGNPITGLNPSIVMKQGDLTTEASDNTVEPITVTSVSSADTTGIMRYSATDGTYIYNMKVNVSLNQPYTIVITPNIAGYPSGMTLKHKITATK
jgi:hypothetical protein